jgi:hypothetical protein
MKMYKWIIICGLVAVSASACAGWGSEDGHKLFLLKGNSRIGTSIEKYSWYRASERLSERRLANGNMEYKYPYSGGCVVVIQVNPSTNIMMSFGWEGEKAHCIANP